MSFCKRNPDLNYITTMSEETKPIEEDHYVWGASGAKTWRGCKGSPNYVAQEKAKGNIPESSDTEWSLEGTKAHAYADDYLTGKITEEEIPANFLEHLHGYFTLATHLADTVGLGECIVMNEQRVPYWYEPTQSGTLDYGVVAEDASELAILDLKYGVGVYVTAKENDQGIIYATSLIKKLEGDGYVFKPTTAITFYIYQPRHRDFTGEAESWQITYAELMDYAIDVDEDYIESREADPDDRTPSEGACRFCDARVVCTKKTMEMFTDVSPEVNMLKPTSHEVQLPEIESLNDEARVAIFRRHKEIAKWMQDVVNDSLALIEHGNTIVGLKTIDGKEGNRSWGDNEAEAEKLLRKIPAAKRYKPRRVLSPAQAEKVLKKEDTPLGEQSTKFQNRWKQLIFRKTGTPSLALESDPSPARITGPDQFDEQETAPVIDVETTPVVAADDCF